MAMSEKIQLLGKGLYKDIPDELTLKSMPTVSELEYVSAEDFDKTMIEKILPQCVEEKGINFNHLLEIDYNWVLRCLRILNYGPYVNTNMLYCSKCGSLRGDYQVDFNSVECIPLPEGFTNVIKIDRTEFIDYKGDIVLHMPTIKEMLDASNDKQFNKGDVSNVRFARMCYMIKEMGTEKNLTPIEVKIKIQKELSPADYLILKEKVKEVTNYGLRAGGQTICPRCGKEATFVLFIDDRYFRPTVENVRTWKINRAKGKEENAAGSETDNVRKHNGRSTVHSKSV